VSRISLWTTNAQESKGSQERLVWLSIPHRGFQTKPATLFIVRFTFSELQHNNSSYCHYNKTQCPSCQVFQPSDCLPGTKLP